MLVPTITKAPHNQSVGKSIFLALLVVNLIACGSKDSIVGTYEDRDWEVKTRVDTWKFTDKEFSKETKNTDRPYPSSAIKGTYVKGDKTITFTYQHFISYKADGSVRSDRTPVGDNTETSSFSRDGDKLVIDAENKTFDGKRILTPIK